MGGRVSADSARRFFMSADGNSLLIGFSPNSGRPVRLSEESVEHGIAVFGSTGSGKTKGLIEPIIDHIIEDPRQPSAVIFNIKDGLGEFVREKAALHGQEHRVFELKPNGPTTINLLAQWMSAGKLGDSLVHSVIAPGEMTDSINAFWVQSAAYILNSIISLLRATSDAADVTINDVYSVCHEFLLSCGAESGQLYGSELLQKLLLRLREKTHALPADHPDRRRMSYELTMAERHVDYMIKLDERPKSSMLAEIMRIFRGVLPFEFASVVNGKSQDNPIDIRRIVDQGQLLVVDFPPQIHGLAGSIICKLVKAQFFTYLIHSRGPSPSTSHRPLYIIADEYQNFATFGEQEDHDNSISAVARSLGLRYIVSCQEPQALYNVAGRAARGMVDNFLRNVRTQIYLRQNSSYDIRRWLEERRLPAVIDHMLPTLRTFTGLLVEDGGRVNMVRLKPSFEAIDHEPSKLSLSALESKRDTLISRWLRSTTGAKRLSSCGNPRRVLVVPSPGTSSLATMDLLEDSLLCAGIPMIRVDGVQLHDPAFQLRMASSFRFSDELATAGVVIVDHLELVPATLEAWQNLNGLISGTRFNTGIPGCRIDFSTIAVVASYEAECKQRIGFPQVTRNSHGLPYLPDKIRQAFRILQLSPTLTRRTGKEVA